MNFKSKILFFFSALLLTFSACVPEDEEGGRIPELGEAPNMRIVVDPNFNSINADDPSTAKVVMDFYSENIEQISEVNLFVDMFDFVTKETTDKVFLKSVPVGSFSGGVLTGYEISFEEFRSALGLEAADFEGLDQVTIYNETTMNDGRVYPSDIQLNQNVTINNVTPNIQNSTQTTSFTTTVLIFVQCPLPDGFALGDYNVEQVSGPADPFFGNDYRWAPGPVTVTGAGINRTFAGSYFTFGVDFNFVVTCGVLVVPRTVTGIGCGGPTLGWEQDGVNGYTDDAEFTITLFENVDGACGLPAAEPLVLKLTKL